MWVCWEGSEECGCAGRGVRSVGVLGGECGVWVYLEESEECGCAGRRVRSVGLLGGE